MNTIKVKVLDVVAYVVVCPLIFAWGILALLFGTPVVVLAWAFDRIDTIGHRNKD